jgi:hypothetical protein
VDVFSLGVILFVMVTGTMPYYQTASIEDPLYKHIVAKDYSQYWKDWEKMRMIQIDDIDKTEFNKQTMKEVLLDEDDNLMLEFWFATWDIFK